jgi:hypothetical protein
VVAERSSNRSRAVNAKESSASPHSRSRSSCTTLRDWYADELRSKVARAVMEGRVDAARAAELHRLMTQLLEADLRHATDLERTRRMDNQASR